MKWQEIRDHPQFRDLPSPSNSEQEMDEKRGLYFTCGAREFWTCSQNGKVRFFDRRRELVRSDLIPRFPDSIETDFA